MKRLIALPLAAVLALLPGTASAASIGEKCDALVDELNARREPNVRLRWLLCSIAHNRARHLANGYMGPSGNGHWIAYVMRKLDEAGVCWRGVGEAIGWTTATGTPRALAERFVSLWRNSPNHWPMLSSSTYDRAGGSTRVGIVNPSRTYAVLLVMDSCA